MTSFLQKIHDITLDRVAAARAERSLSDLERTPLFARQPGDVPRAFRRDGYNIIAEIKFASPSEGDIAKGDPVTVADGYLKAGAAMLSILTEPRYFKGDLDYLSDVRERHPYALLLRKDFMVDPYQLYEAKACGADAILLIVAMTPPEVTKDLFEAAKGLGLAALVEVHDARELDEAAEMGATLLGVNNRNLKTLKTDLNIGRELAARKPEGSVFICESGLATAADLRDMRGRGYDGFLMGTSFMKQPQPGAALQTLQEQLKCA
ncbi:MAG TPA: indole-3-glycerol phosphate synthase TrpC [Patescibacteria group bacterium]|nr:indole-3-glycerol phosphate synthase TrpC [Patescibacteria group bacterium]